MREPLRMRWKIRGGNILVARKKLDPLELPKRLTDIISLADWLELSALISASKSSSRVALERALRCSSVFQSKGSGEDEKLDEVLLQVFQELEARAIAAGDGYPFSTDSSVLRLRSAKSRDFSAYFFCLILSYFGWKQKKDAPINPWKLFEELSRVAAGQYIHGDCYWFALRGKDSGAKKPDVKAFEKAINELCVHLGEGTDFAGKATLNSQDDNVDLVAWREFRDKRPSKLVMFGQCASGANWTEKVDELQPNIFWDQWMRESKVSPLIRSFYMPHRLPVSEWDYYARRTGILFDRCRIALCTAKDKTILTDKRYLEWSNSVLPVFKNA